jgi:hypothetical protein
LRRLVGYEDFLKKGGGTAKERGFPLSAGAEAPRQAGPDIVDVLLADSRNSNPEVEREPLLLSPDHARKRGIRPRSVVGSLRCSLRPGEAARLFELIYMSYRHPDDARP